VQSHIALQVVFCADLGVDCIALSPVGNRTSRFGLLRSERETVMAHSRLNNGSIAGDSKTMLVRWSGDVFVVLALGVSDRGVFFT
jgi:hypothetical protein